MYKIHIHILSTHSVLLDILNYQYTLYTVCTHLYIVICEGATDYKCTADGCATDLTLLNMSLTLQKKQTITCLENPKACTAWFSRLK